MKKIILNLSLIFLLTSPVQAHDDNESRIKFWKEYYNPKVEVTDKNIPSVKVTLIKK
jgi:hypothetical protein